MDTAPKAAKLNTSSETRRLKDRPSDMRIPEFSRLHSTIPQLYVPEWKTDMKNRKLIIQNADIGNIPHHEHDENLFLDKREQMYYNVEDRGRVETKYELPSRSRMLQPNFHHANSKYQSGLMCRKDAPEK